MGELHEIAIRQALGRPQQPKDQPPATARIASNGRIVGSDMDRFTGCVMRLELHYRSDIDLSRSATQVEVRNHIARCLRDYPDGGEGVITLDGVEHCFVYIVNGDVVDAVIGPPDYIEQVINARWQNTHEDAPPDLKGKEHE